jgi:hypothetical protein
MFFRRFLEGINFNAELVLRGFIIDNGDIVILKKSVLKIKLYALIDKIYFFLACNQEKRGIMLAKLPGKKRKIF